MRSRGYTGRKELSWNNEKRSKERKDKEYPSVSTRERVKERKEMPTPIKKNATKLAEFTQAIAEDDVETFVKVLPETVSIQRLQLEVNKHDTTSQKEMPLHGVWNKYTTSKAVQSGGVLRIRVLLNSKRNIPKADILTGLEEVRDQFPEVGKRRFLIVSVAVQDINNGATAVLRSGYARIGSVEAKRRERVLVIARTTGSHKDIAKLLGSIKTGKKLCKIYRRETTVRVCSA